MTSYNLKCDNHHEFEAWFKNAASFQSQCENNFVECPICNSHHITKLPSAPNIATKSNTHLPALPANKDNIPTPEEMNVLHTESRKMVAYIQENFDNVGDKFPEEIRKIHYEETDKRNIYGKADMEELSKLHEEGIDCQIMPDFDKNN